MIQHLSLQIRRAPEAKQIKETDSEIHLKEIQIKQEPINSQQHFTKETSRQQEPIKEKTSEIPTHPAAPQQKTEEEKFREEERVAQEVLKRLQDKKINKPRWAL